MLDAVGADRMSGALGQPDEIGSREPPALGAHGDGPTRPRHDPAQDRGPGFGPARGERLLQPPVRRAPLVAGPRGEHGAVPIMLDLQYRWDRLAAEEDPLDRVPPERRRPIRRPGEDAKRRPEA